MTLFSLCIAASAASPRRTPPGIACVQRRGVFALFSVFFYFLFWPGFWFASRLHCLAQILKCLTYKFNGAIMAAHAASRATPICVYVCTTRRGHSPGPQRYTQIHSTKRDGAGFSGCSALLTRPQAKVDFKFNKVTALSGRELPTQLEIGDLAKCQELKTNDQAPDLTRLTPMKITWQKGQPLESRSFECPRLNGLWNLSFFKLPVVSIKYSINDFKRISFNIPYFQK